MLLPNRSSIVFLQRLGLEATVVGPIPSISPSTMLINKYPLVAPLPYPELSLRDEGTPPPDRGRTATWPHGDDGVRL